MFDAGGIASVLGLDINPWRQGMMEATSIASVFPSTVTNFLANPLLGLVDVAGKAAGAIKGVAEAWVDAIDQIGQKFDDVGDTAERLGVSSEFLSGWGAAFEDAGSSAQGLADAIKFVNQNAADAAGGNEQAAAKFEKVGISADFVSANLHNTEAIVRAVVHGISQLPTRAEQTAAAMDLMGRGAGEAIGVLAGGTQKIEEFARHHQRLGGQITTENARWGDSYAKLRGDVETAMDGIRRAAAAPVLFMISENLDAEREGVATAADAIQKTIEELVWDALRLGAMALDMVSMNEESLSRFLPPLQAIGQHLKDTVAGGFLVAAAAAAAFADQLEIISKLADKALPGGFRVWGASGLGSAGQIMGWDQEDGAGGGPTEGPHTRRVREMQERYEAQKSGIEISPTGNSAGGSWGTVNINISNVTSEQALSEVNSALRQLERRQTMTEAGIRSAHARGRI